MNQNSTKTECESKRATARINKDAVIAVLGLILAIVLLCGIGILGGI